MSRKITTKFHYLQISCRFSIERNNPHRIRHEVKVGRHKDEKVCETGEPVAQTLPFIGDTCYLIVSPNSR